MGASLEKLNQKRLEIEDYFLNHGVYLYPKGQYWRMNKNILGRIFDNLLLDYLLSSHLITLYGHNII